MGFSIPWLSATSRRRSRKEADGGPRSPALRQCPGLRHGPALLALLLVLPGRAADPWPGGRPSGAPAHALIQLAGQPLSGGRSHGSANLPLERAEGGHTPVLEIQVSGAGAAAGASPAASHQGAPIRLLLDTGATSTMVTPELAERLALERRPMPPNSFALAGGGQGCADQKPERTRLPDLVLRAPGEPAEGPALHLEGIEALVLPVRALPAGVDGVLGAPTLRLQPIRIDPVQGRIALGAVALEGVPLPPSPFAVAARPRWRRLPLRWHRGVPLLQLASSSGTVEALADTGAEGLFLQSALAARLRPLGPALPLRLVGFCGEQRVERRRFSGIGLGAEPGGIASVGAPPSPGDGADGVEGIVTENPIFEQLGVEAILGQELLRHHRQLWRLDLARPELLLW